MSYLRLKIGQPGSKSSCFFYTDDTTHNCVGTGFFSNHDNHWYVYSHLFERPLIDDSLRRIARIIQSRYDSNCEMEAKGNVLYPRGIYQMH